MRFIWLPLFLSIVNVAFSQQFADPCYNESTVCISESGKLYGWGRTTYGLWQGGTGDYIDKPQVFSPPNDSSTWLQVSTSDLVTYLITDRNDLYVCSDKVSFLSKKLQAKLPIDHPTYFESDLGVTKWQQIKLFVDGVIALSTSGEAYGWGQLPSKTTGTNVFLADSPYHIPRPPTVNQWIDVESSNDDHILLLGDDKNLYGIGTNDSGQLGTGDTLESLIPRKVNLPIGETGWKAMALTSQYSVGLTESGKLYEWGYLDLNNVLSRKSLIPKLIPFVFEGELPVIIKASATKNIILLTDQGNVYTWGKNGVGECGLGDHFTPHPYPSRIQQPSQGSKWTVIGGGFYSSYGVDEKCNLYAWGGNYYAELLPNPILNHTIDTPTFILNLCDSYVLPLAEKGKSTKTIIATSNSISIPLSENDKVDHVLVCNIIGSCIQIQPNIQHTDKITIDLTKLANGFYTIIYNNNSIKLLLQR
jgi:alpha-tubulin suppressor-like RCC1 family protein